MAQLVLTERVTRFQHIVLIKDKTQKRVISAINRLERKMGKELFHTPCSKALHAITTLSFKTLKVLRNQFSARARSAQESILPNPYSSFERGNNENANRLIKRFLPKGTTFDKLRQRDVQRLALWMNKIPRKILDGMSAKDKAKELGLDFYPAKS